MKKAVKLSGKSIVRPKSNISSQDDFDEVLTLIDAARLRATSAVNTTLIELYWSVGEYISRKIESATWGEGVVDQLADHIARTHPGLREYTRANLFRMRQFYETYGGDEKVSALLRQLPWTHNLLILGKSKRAEEREFYLRMATSEKWSSRELERQINGERAAGGGPSFAAAEGLPCCWLTPDDNCVTTDDTIVVTPQPAHSHSHQMPEEGGYTDEKQYLTSG